MKHRLFSLLLVLVLLLTGCGVPAPETEPPESGQTIAPAPESGSSGEQEYLWDNLPFSIVFPLHWQGRYRVMQQDDGITVSVDGQPTFAVRVVENKPGANQRDQDLVALGYRYLLENGEYFIYVKVLSYLPEELYIVNRLNMTVENYCHWYTRNTFVSMLRFQDSSMCRLNLASSVRNKKVTRFDYAYDRDVNGNLYGYLSMKENVYVNYRLGVSIAIPDSLRDRCELICLENYYYSRILVEYRHRKEDGSWDDYYLCNLDVYTNADGVLWYEGFNQWQDYWDPDAYMERTWSRYPKEIKELFTFEEVQQIVDSFTILDSNP